MAIRIESIFDVSNRGTGLPLHSFYLAMRSGFLVGILPSDFRFSGLQINDNADSVIVVSELYSFNDNEIILVQ